MRWLQLLWLLLLAGPLLGREPILHPLTAASMEERFWGPYSPTNSDEPLIDMCLRTVYNWFGEDGIVKENDRQVPDDVADILIIQHPGSCKQPCPCTFTNDTPPVCDLVLASVVNRTVVFDASGTTDPENAIATFTFDLGDGNVTVSGSPILNHTYATDGNFTVTMTATTNNSVNCTSIIFVAVSGTDLCPLDPFKTSPMLCGCGINDTMIGQPCFTALPGVCSTGSIACFNGTAFCVQDAFPSAENCSDAYSDLDCDGLVECADLDSCGLTPACINETIDTCFDFLDCSDPVCDNLTRSCYTGPLFTEGVGECSGGTEQCLFGFSTGCLNETTPQPEDCFPPDRDCDGSPTNGFFGLGMNCTLGIGFCSATGVITCNPNGTATYCNGTAGTPAAENCTDPSGDLDCDGQAGCDDVGDCATHPACLNQTIQDCFDIYNCVPAFCFNLSRPCYTGPNGTEGVGACSGGFEFCLFGGPSTGCLNETTPTAEFCAFNSSLDLNCNGIFGCSDDDCAYDLACQNTTNLDCFFIYDCNITQCINLTIPCYTGPNGTAGVGECQFGINTCLPTLNASGCIGDVTPQPENCNVTMDRDCDGNPTNGFSTGNCSLGLGECQASGFFQCNLFDNGTFCDAVPGTPTNETCNSLDDDCNGIVDDVNATLLQSDDSNCGVCGNVCPFNTTCVLGTCEADPIPFTFCVTNTFLAVAVATLDVPLPADASNGLVTGCGGGGPAGTSTAGGGGGAAHCVIDKPVNLAGVTSVKLTAGWGRVGGTNLHSIDSLVQDQSLVTLMTIHAGGPSRDVIAVNQNAGCGGGNITTPPNRLADGNCVSAAFGGGVGASIPFTAPCTCSIVGIDGIQQGCCDFPGGGGSARSGTLCGAICTTGGPMRAGGSGANAGLVGFRNGGSSALGVGGTTGSNPGIGGGGSNLAPGGGKGGAGQACLTYYAHCGNNNTDYNFGEQCDGEVFCDDNCQFLCEPDGSFFTDPLNCGACNNHCDIEAGETCVAGVCTSTFSTVCFENGTVNASFAYPMGSTDRTFTGCGGGGAGSTGGGGGAQCSIYKPINSTSLNYTVTVGSGGLSGTYDFLGFGQSSFIYDAEAGNALLHTMFGGGYHGPQDPPIAGNIEGAGGSGTLEKGFNLTGGDIGGGDGGLLDRSNGTNVCFLAGMGLKVGAHDFGGGGGSPGGEYSCEQGEISCGGVQYAFPGKEGIYFKGCGGASALGINNYYYYGEVGPGVGGGAIYDYYGYGGSDGGHGKVCFHWTP